MLKSSPVRLPGATFPCRPAQKRDCFPRHSELTHIMEEEFSAWWHIGGTSKIFTCAEATNTPTSSPPTSIAKRTRSSTTFVQAYCLVLRLCGPILSTRCIFTRAEVSFTALLSSGSSLDNRCHPLARYSVCHLHFGYSSKPTVSKLNVFKNCYNAQSNALQRILYPNDDTLINGPHHAANQWQLTQSTFSKTSKAEQ